jgi:transposase
VLVVLQLFVMRSSYSGRLFARVSWRCDQPALFAGMLEALIAFGGVPRNAVFDNASAAVKRVLSGRSRDENLTFRAFAGSLAMPIAFAAPAKGSKREVNEFKELRNAAYTALCDVATCIKRGYIPNLAAARRD